MFEKCANCGAVIIGGGVRDSERCFCSRDCQAFFKHPGFCPSCLGATLAESSGDLQMVNGCGSSFRGRREECPTCKSVIRTRYFCLFWIPIIPLGEYRVIYPSGRRFEGRSFLSRRVGGEKGPASHPGEQQSPVADRELLGSPKPRAPNSRRIRNRKLARAAVLLGVFLFACLLIKLGHEGWRLGGVFPTQHIGYPLIVLVVLGICGVNIWSRGPLDPRGDLK